MFNEPEIQPTMSDCFSTSTTRSAQRLQWARHVCGDHSLQLEPASADASARSYWRPNQRERQYLVMDSPPATEPLQPWLAVRAHLATAGVRVPAVFDVDCNHGFALLEDLGPATLLSVLTPDSADRWFKAALAQLIRLQRAPIPANIGHFDARQLERDASLFSDWFLQHHLQLHLSRTVISALGDIQSHMADCLDRQPSVLVHRDFMPRNLIPLDEEVAVIDFQDCLRGPISYDPISLFKDTQISWPLSAIKRWLSAYYDWAQQAGLLHAPLPQFLQDADWMGIQRHLKVLGIFARLHHRDGKSHYLAEIPRIVHYLIEILPQYPLFAPLYTLLLDGVLPALAQQQLVQRSI